MTAVDKWDGYFFHFEFALIANKRQIGAHRIGWDSGRREMSRLLNFWHFVSQLGFTNT